MIGWVTSSLLEQVLKFDNSTIYIYIHIHVFRPSQDSSVWLRLTSREQLYIYIYKILNNNFEEIQQIEIVKQYIHFWFTFIPSAWTGLSSYISRHKFQKFSNTRANNVLLWTYRYHDNPHDNFLFWTLFVFFEGPRMFSLSKNRHRRGVLHSSPCCYCKRKKNKNKGFSLTHQHRQMVQACLMSLFYRHFNVY